MDDQTLDTPYSHAATVHPGRLTGHKDYAPVKPKQRCLSCGCALTTGPSKGAILSIHLMHSPECRDSYVARDDTVGIGLRRLVIVSTLHTFRKVSSGRWSVKGVAPNGELLEVRKCRNKKDAQKTLAMFCVKEQVDAVMLGCARRDLHGNNAG